MKKIINSMLVAILAIGTMFTMTGCDKESVYRDAGRYAVMAWVAIDNPSDEVKAVVIDSIDYVIEHANEYEPGKFFSDMFYDKLVEIIDGREELDDAVKVYVKAGTLVILEGLDMLMADNEKIAEKADEAVKAAKAFAEGAKSILVPSNSKIVSKQLSIARSAAEKRAALGLK